jgi:NAD+ synthase
MLYLAEYKRRQSAPGVKITTRSFGRDRRYPITNKFRESLEAPAGTQSAISAPRIVRPRADGGEVS